MRFELNKKYVFFAFQHTYDNGKTVEKPFAFPTTDLDVEIKDVTFIEATCVHHEKVPCHWDTSENKELKYDGFLFDWNGLEGRNQYPNASYGQMDDSADGQINFLNAYSKIKPVDDIVKDDHYIEYHLFTRHMENIERGIHQLGKATWDGAPEKLQKLEARKAMFIEALKTQLNKGVLIEQFSVTTESGKVIAPEGMKRVTIIDLDK